MDSRMAGLKAGLANVASGLEHGRNDKLMRSLEAAANEYAATEHAAQSKNAAERADAETARENSAFAALLAVMERLRDERLEAPFRHLFDLLEAHQRKRLRTKPLDKALEGAHLAAAVDALMADKRLSLDQACRDVARQAEGNMTGEKLKDLRESIKRGRARPEAVELYELLCRPDRTWAPGDERPAPLLKRVRRPRPKTGMKA